MGPGGPPQARQGRPTPTPSPSPSPSPSRGGSLCSRTHLCAAAGKAFCTHRRSYQTFKGSAGSIPGAGGARGVPRIPRRMSSDAAALPKGAFEMPHGGTPEQGRLVQAQEGCEATFNSPMNSHSPTQALPQALTRRSWAHPSLCPCATWPAQRSVCRWEGRSCQGRLASQKAGLRPPQSQAGVTSQCFQRTWLWRTRRLRSGSPPPHTAASPLAPLELNPPFAPHVLCPTGASPERGEGSQGCGGMEAVPGRWCPHQGATGESRLENALSSLWRPWPALKQLCQLSLLCQLCQLSLLCQLCQLSLL